MSSGVDIELNLHPPEMEVKSLSFWMGKMIFRKWSDLPTITTSVWGRTGIRARTPDSWRGDLSRHVMVPNRTFFSFLMVGGAWQEKERLSSNKTFLQGLKSRRGKAQGHVPVPESLRGFQEHILVPSHIVADLESQRTAADPQLPAVTRLPWPHMLAI